MSTRFEELGFAETPIGQVALWRRLDPVTKQDVFEVKLNDEWLMSSQFNVAEIELSRIALSRLGDDAPGDAPATGTSPTAPTTGTSATSPAAAAAAAAATLDVVVGGLGLGYTAAAALEDPRVRELAVVELIEPVIEWHQRGLVPVGPTLSGDARCRLVAGDFFAMALGDGFDPDAPGRQWDAIALDIDHSPVHVLDDGSAGFYGVDGMSALARHLRPGGVYAMWSNDPPDDAYMAVLGEVFQDARADVITFPNPLQGRDATATIYSAVAR